MTDDLTDFLLARIAEDEAAAEEAAENAQRWIGRPPAYDWEVVERNYGGIEVWSTGESDGGDRASAVTAHIARHDPASVLAECEAKRRIVTEYQDPDSVGGYSDGLWHALACLALPYAGHPDYREDWRP